VRSVLVPESTITTEEPIAPLVSVAEGATVADLISALRTAKLTTRDVIAVLQSVKSAGALDGDLIIQ
jgi:flagellar P-ring protein precursor FlgI